MSKYCTIYPYVKAEDGSFKESRLFKDLLSLNSNNREAAKNIYFSLKSPSFIKGLNENQIDELGEPILSKVLNTTQVKTLISEASVKQNLLKSLGGEQQKDDTVSNYLELSRKANDFNDNSEYKDRFVAIVNKKDNTISLSIEEANNENVTIAKKQLNNTVLYDRIKDILTSSGIDISIVDNLQERLKANGVVDYDASEKTANGIINLIQLANNSSGVNALSEEFAHLSFDLLDDNDSFKTRLLSILDNEEVLKSIFRESYDSYNNLYSNRDDLLREAAGKLINQSWFSNNNQLSEYSTFIGKFINNLKQRIKSLFTKESFQSALYEANQIASILSARFLNNSTIESEDLKRLKGLNNLYQLANGAEAKKDILNKAISNMIKKETFYIESLNKRLAKERDPNEIIALQNKLANYQQSMNDKIDSLKDALDNNRIDEGIQNFIIYSASELTSASAKLNKLITSSDTIQYKCATLRNLKNIYDSIKGVANDINTSLQYTDTDLNIDDATKTAVNEIIEKLNTFKSVLNNECQKNFATFLSAYFNENETVTYKVGKEYKQYTKDDILDLIKTAEHDISIIDNWLESTANCNDLVLNLADKAMQQAKGKVKIQVEEIQQRLLSAAKTLKDSGSDDSFMFERHADGTLSNRYISSINWTAYFDDYNKVIETGNDAEIKLFKFTHWDFENNVPLGYDNPNFFNSLTDAQKVYYTEFMNIRTQLIENLPISTYARDPMKAVQMSKSLVERMISNNPSKWGSQLYKAFRDSYTVKTDDTNYGVKNVIKGFNDEEIYTIPIFYVNNIEDNDLFRDTASSLIAFADMSINYKEMSAVTDLFEVGRLAMENREAKVIKNDNVLVEELGGITRNVLKKNGNLFLDRYNSFLNTQMYSRYIGENDSVGSVGKDGRQTSANKLAKLLNRVSSLNQLALNFMAGLAAVGTDIITVNSEVVGAAFSKKGTLFNAGDLLKADGIYSKNIIHVLGEMGNPIKKNKLNLFIDYFDILHEYENEVKNIGWSKNKVRKLFSENSLYFFMTAGSHFGETRTAIAQAINKKITSDDGTQTKSLWDILQVVPIDANNPEKGNKLVVEDGFTLSDADRIAFSRSCNGLNQDLYGIYSKQDISKMETTAIGQLVFLYRRFIVSSINRRYGSAQHNFNTGLDREGYYRSCAAFIRNIIKDSNDFKTAIVTQWDNLTDVQRANIGKAINEMGTFTILAVLVGIVSKTDWGDKDSPWAKRLIAYMSKRLKTETGAFAPVGVTGELFDIIKSPAASIQTLEGIKDIATAINPFKWYGDEDIIKSGRYKGRSKGYRALMNSPLIPMNKTIYKALHPEVGLAFYNQN